MNYSCTSPSYSDDSEIEVDIENSLWLRDAYLGQHWLRYTGLLRDGTKPLAEPMLTHH